MSKKQNRRKTPTSPSPRFDASDDIVESQNNSETDCKNKSNIKTKFKIKKFQEKNRLTIIQSKMTKILRTITRKNSEAVTKLSNKQTTMKQPEDQTNDILVPNSPNSVDKPSIMSRMKMSQSRIGAYPVW